MSSSNCCFLTCIQVSQEAGQVVWYSHLFQNFPQFVAIHRVKDCSIVSEAKVDFVWNFLAFSVIHWILGVWSAYPAFSKSSSYIWKFLVHVLLKPGLENYFASIWIECRTLKICTSSIRIWNSSVGIPSPPLALFIVMLPKAHFALHSRLSGSRRRERRLQTEWGC